MGIMVFQWCLIGFVCSIIHVVWNYHRGVDFTIKDIPAISLGIVLGPIFACILAIMFFERNNHILIRGKNLIKNKDEDKDDCEKQLTTNLKKSTLKTNLLDNQG